MADFHETEELVLRSGAGDPRALEELFSRHRERLRRMVQIRLDRRLRSRMDDSDVLQDVYLDAARRLPEYLRDPKIPFFVWLRSLAGQKLVDLHRLHLGAKARDLRREVPIRWFAMPEATSAVLAAQLLGTATTPSDAVHRAEMELKVQQALEVMEPHDREVLVLRHFEGLANHEIAHELGIETSAASKRYLRALRKLEEILAKQQRAGESP
jgi:RNA polymerase sigma-70 factor (ECF subfamily)